MTEAMHLILVVEDDPAIRNLLRALLESERFRFTEATTAGRAEMEARAHKPDLPLVELGLPDGDGLTVIRHVREWSPVPIMVLFGENRGGAEDCRTRCGSGRLCDQALQRTRAGAGARRIAAWRP